MRHTVFVITLVISMNLGVPERGVAQATAPPTIHNVTLHEGAGVLTITGTGFGREPRVTIAGQPVNVLSGGTEIQIDVVAPAALLTIPGSYRLTLVDAARQVGDAFVVASHAGAMILSGTPSAINPSLAGAVPAAAGSPVTEAVAGVNGPGRQVIEDPDDPYRTALGYQALLLNTTGGFNTATGFRALRNNTTGSSNTASGLNALHSNTTGFGNTANGVQALEWNATGYENTAIGVFALQNNQTGKGNTALGVDAGSNSTTGSYNLFLGAQVTGTAGDAITIRIGRPFSGGLGQNKTFIAGIYGTQLTGPAVQVFIDANGQLGTVTAGVQTGTIDVPVGQLEEQVREQQAAIDDLRARLDVPANGIVLAPAAASVTGASPTRSLHGPGRQVIEDSGPPYRTAIGFKALLNTTGDWNTGSGYQALHSNTTGGSNTANGANALYSNTTGSANTASGREALYSNTTGYSNTASGYQALTRNTTGAGNTASGNWALYFNTTGERNTASGAFALHVNMTGGRNTASGYQALTSNTGDDNTADGYFALKDNTTGFGNTAGGHAALKSNTTGTRNVAFGSNAGYNVTTGSWNLFLGAEVLGIVADTNTIRIGLPYNSANGTGQNKTFIAGIRGTELTGSAVQVFIDENGQLGTVTPGVQSGTIDVPLGQLEQQVRDQEQRSKDQEAVIADLRARLARLEALLAPSAGGN